MFSAGVVFRTNTISIHIKLGEGGGLISSQGFGEDSKTEEPNADGEPILFHRALSLSDHHR